MYRLLTFAFMTFAAATSARAEWVEASSKHFIVYSDDSPDKVKAYATKLEKFDAAMRKLRVVPETTRGPASRVTVFVLDGLEDIQKLYGKGGQNVGGFYEARASGSVAFVPRRANGESAEQIFLHEYGHHFMYTDWPTAIFPKWFSEGFAEFHATAIFGEDGSVIFGAVPTSRRYGVLEGNMLPVSKMLQPDPGRLDDMATYVLYSRGWLLTHYLTFDPERRARLARYIAAINEGKSSKEAIAMLTQGSGDLDLKLDSYVRRPKLPSIRFAASELPIREIVVRTLGPGEAATMPARLRSQRGVDAASAPKVAAVTRQMAAPYPNDAAAQNVLAEAEFDVASIGPENVADAGYARALAAADRALAADPRSSHALLYKGMALQAMAEKAGATDVRKWQEIRRLYIAANKLDPENPQPLILYHASFGAAKARAPVSAENGLLYAYALAPYDLGLRVEAARVYLKQGKAAEGRAAFLPVAYNPHADAPERLRSIIKTLDTAGPAAALAEFEKLEAETKSKADEAKRKAAKT